MMVTVALGMIAPFMSVTAPLMVPNIPCAVKLLGQKLPIAKITAITVTIDLAFVILISKMFWLWRSHVHLGISGMRRLAGCVNRCRRLTGQHFPARKDFMLTLLFVSTLSGFLFHLG
jgi:hypothetical protein